MRFNFTLAEIPFLTLFAVSLSAQDAQIVLSAKLAPVQPCPALVIAARTNQIPLNQIGPPTDGDTINPGDSLTALVTFYETNARQTQWLLDLQAVTPNAKEQSVKPQPPLVIYSSCGNKLEFAPAPAFVNLRTLGPFAEADAKRKPPKALDKSERFALNTGFLSLGLDRASAAVLRLNQADPTRKAGAFSFGSKAFSDAEIIKSKKMAERFQFTADEERALAGSAPALMSYFEIVQRTAGLENILFKIVDLPSLWSMIRHGGVNANIRMDSKHIAAASTTVLPLPTNPALYQYPLVLELNNQPALNITLIVTAPQPPLLSCGGIVAMVVERPGSQGAYMTLRVISARSSATKRQD